MRRILLLSLGMILADPSLATAYSQPNTVTESGGPAVSNEESPLPTYVNVIDGRSNPDAIPQEMLIWNLVSVLQQIDVARPGSAAELLTHTVGLSAEAATIAVSNAKSAFQEYQQTEVESGPQTCSPEERARVAQLDNISRAAELRAAELASQKAAALKAATFLQGLNAEAREKLTNWVETSMRGNVSTLEFDFEGYFASSETARQEFEDGACRDK